jgi:hypothetical protein
MAGQIIISNIKTDSDNAFSILANTGAVLFSANLASGITTGIPSNSIANTQIISVANTKITGTITGSQIAPSVTLTTPIISGNLNLDSTGTTGVQVPSANTMAFYEGGVEAMRIDSAGNVGIGTTSPTAKLGVTRSGNGYIQRWTNGTVITALYQDSSITSFGNDTNHDLILTANDSGVGRFTSAGLFQINSGYGTTATAYGCRAWVNFNGADNSNLTGTYSQSGTAMTVTITSHGLTAGQSVRITFQTGDAGAEIFTVESVTNANVFVVTSVTSRTTSGNCTLNFNTIRGSGNVSSITDNGTGQYTINLTTSLPDTNYAIVTSCGTPTQAKITADINQVGDGPYTDSPPTVSRFRITTTNYASTSVDSKYVSVSVFR